MSAAPLVAVVTRTRDRSLFLRRALKSVAAQDYENIVHIIVNDGGEFARVEADIADVAGNAHRIDVVTNEESLGREAAVNPGFTRALELGATYVTVVDDDDTIAPDAINARVKYLEQHADEVAVGCDTEIVHEHIDGDAIIEESREPWRAGEAGVTLGELLQHNMLPPIAILFRAGVLRELKGWREDAPVLGDWDFMVRLALLGPIGSLHRRLAQWHWRNTADIRAGNSIVTDADEHRVRAALIRDGYLRADNPANSTEVPAGGAGLGIPLLIGGVQENMRDALGESMNEIRGAFRDIHQALHNQNVTKEQRDREVDARLNSLEQSVITALAGQTERIDALAKRMDRLERDTLIGRGRRFLERR